MNSIDRYQEYIQDTVISHLERLMNGDNGEPEVNLYEKYYMQGGYPPKDSVYKSMLHAMMVPYYRMYLNGDHQLCKPNMEFIRLQMKHAIDDDDQFGRWASEQDLIVSAEGWGDNLKRIPEDERIKKQYFYVLKALLQTDCQQDWHALSEELKEMLFKAEVYSDYKTDEVLCALHAFTMIMQQDWPKEKKIENLELLRLQWKFMKHYYSVMTRHIIGVKWTEFHKVAETVMTSSQSFKPHMHIFYSGLMDCVDELHLDKKHQRKMDKICLQMQEEVTRYEPSDLLYELCDAIFPEDFQRQLRENRPKSYKEIENESHQKDELIQQLKDQTSRTRKELEKSKEIIERMVLSSIPIEDIDAELEQYPTGTAWDMLKDLNANPIICMQKAWREHYPELFKKYRERLFGPIEQQKELTEAMMMVAERPTISEYYASGSTHDDKRSQLLLGEEIEKVARLKMLSNG
jgi:hypothetical protein